jgi:hypothetical protein
MQQPINGPIEPPAPPPSQGIRYIDALKFLFTSDGAWNNILLVTVLLLIPVVGQLAMYGWYCEIMQRLARNHPQPIPKFSFSDFGHYLGRGVYPFVTRLIVSLPFSMVMGVLGGVMGFAMMFMLRTAPHHTRGGAPPTELFILYGCFIGLSLLMSPFITVFVNAGLMRAELTEDLGKTFNVSGLLNTLKLTWFTSLYSSIVYGFIAFFVGVIGMLCCYVGLFPAVVILSAGMTHLRFQVYQRYLAKGGAPFELKPPAQLPSEQPGMPR